MKFMPLFLFFNMVFNVSCRTFQVSSLKDSPCDDSTITDIAPRILRILDTPSIWKAYAPKKSKFFFHGKTGEVYAYGFSKESLIATGVYERTCSIPEIYEVKLQINKPSDSFELLNDPKVFGTLSPILKKLVELALPSPTLSILVPSESVFRERFSSTIVHENFHNLQLLFWKDLPDETLQSHDLNFRNEFLSECAKNDKWWNSLQQELHNWIESYQSISQMDRNRALELLKKQRAIRRLNLEDQNIKKCWTQLEVWERFEGSAYYVADNNASISSGQTTLKELFLQIEEDLNVTKSNIEKKSFYYVTGDLYFQLFEKIDPTGKWQDLLAFETDIAQVADLLISEKIESKKLVYKFGPWCKKGLKTSVNDEKYINLAGQSRAKNSAVEKWTTINPTTLRFDGIIEVDEYKYFESALKKLNSFDNLILNSPGGNAVAALKINKLIIQNKVSVLVDGVCGSSCANYLFLAGKSKAIQYGWVGYHGNLTAFKMSQTFEQKKGELRKLYLENKISFTEKSIDDEIQEQEKKDSINSFIEQDFLISKGISQTLFDLTQKDDKGSGDQKNYEFLMLSPDAFKYFGIHGVKNAENQDFCFMEKLYGKSPLMTLGE